MSTLYLHIGTPKTGTSAIQHFMMVNNPELEIIGISYPLMEQKGAGQHRNGHFLSTMDYNRELDGKNWKIVSDALSKYDKVVLSDEALFRAGGYNTDFWKNIKKRCQKEGAELKVILYVRRQDDFLLSYYEQAVKDYCRVSDVVDTVINEYMHMPYWDYNRYVSRMETVLGRENIILRAYEKSQMAGGRGSAVDDFLDILGIKEDLYDRFEFEYDMRNPSITDLAVAAKFYFNMVFNSKKTALTYNRCISLQNSVCRRLKSEGKLLKRTGMTTELRSKVMAKYQSSNDALAQKYLGRDTLFNDNSLDKGDEKAVFSKEELEYVYDIWVSEVENFSNCGFTSAQMRDICNEAIKLYDKDINYKYGFLRSKYRMVKSILKILKKEKENADRIKGYPV